ncbi:MAG: molybdenum ABC transporter ATP-binding protein [Pseudomonadota bacterium]
MISVSIAHRFGRFALEVGFEAPAGVTALFGRSGAGKTTVLSAVAGLLTPHSGHIEVDGHALFDARKGIDVPAYRRRIGLVFQDGRLFPHMSVSGNLGFAERFAQDRRAARAERERLVELLGLGPILPRRPALLSGGEKQRVAVARALLQRPAALLLDEPLAALDEPRKAEILPYLERLADGTGIPILYVSHALNEVARLADRIVLMRDGRTVAAGALSEVLSDAEAATVLGPREAGALMDGTVLSHDIADGLTMVRLDAGVLSLPTIAAPPETRVRVRVRASDVILSLNVPEGLTTRNVLPATVETLVRGEGPGALAALRSGSDRLLARVTQREARALDLKPGLPCYAVLKPLAVAPEDVIVRGAPGGI